MVDARKLEAFAVEHHSLLSGPPGTEQAVKGEQQLQAADGPGESKDPARSCPGKEAEQDMGAQDPHWGGGGSPVWVWLVSF